MKVLHVPFCFYPDPVGGTEVYVAALAREQLRRGIVASIAAPDARDRRYMHGELSVARFATDDSQDLSRLYGAGDELARRGFASVLSAEQPDVVHLHAFTPSISAQLARDVVDRGARLVYTYHTPTASCQRGTLLRWGADVCDGVLDTHTCAACTLHGLGLPRTPAALLGSIPPKLGAAMGRSGAAGGPWTALRMTELVQRQHASFKAFVACADRIVVLCNWAADLLQRNGVPPHKLTLSRHGLARSDVAPGKHRSGGTALRVAYVGRLHPTKGVDTLIAALRAQPHLQVTLDVFGIVQDGASSAYERSLRALAENDPRIQLRPPLAGDKVVDSLATYDVLAVPSRWLETGPLVVLEAFAAGRPVVGSRLGGIAELVRHRVDGLLVEPESIVAWGTALGVLATDRHLLSRLTAGVQPPRTVGDVADDMEGAYAALVEREPAVV